MESLCDLDVLIGKYDEAISLEEKAVAALEKSVGAESHDLVSHLVRLSGTYRAGNHTPLAEPVLQRVLALDIRALGPDDAKVSSDYDNLGSAYMENEPNRRRANRLSERIDRAREPARSDHMDVATSYTNLAVAEEKGNFSKMRATDYEKALAISEKKLGDESYSLTGFWTVWA